MRDWEKEFNELPDKIRQVAAIVHAKDELKLLLHEKSRLSWYYNQALREIDSQINSIKEWIAVEGNE